MVAKIIDKNTIKVLDITQFSDATLKCGQVFRYTHLDGDRYRILSGANWAEIDFATGEIICNDSEYFFDYFDFETDYNEIAGELSHFNKLPIIKGIRILRQDFFECVISFIVSANNNIKRFTKTLFSLFDGRDIEVMTEADFAGIGCGYRSSYLVKTIKQLKDYDYKELAKLDNCALRKRLMMLAGIGRKVADCIMLFSFHRLDVVPVDTWIEKVYKTALEDGKETNRTKMAERLQNLWGKYAGIAQQYVFYYMQYLKKDFQ